LSQSKNENLSSAVYLWNVSENFGIEIMDSVYLVRNRFKECLTQNFIPTKFKELWADRCREGLLFYKIVTSGGNQRRKFEVVCTPP
jgi:hypothetical protein